MKFTELELKPAIMRALEKKGYTDLTPIQEQTFPHVLSGRDLIALAETGSGKTAACGIPVVQSVDPEIKAVQALILVPTRELALQYVDEISWIAKETGVNAFAVYGGFNIAIQKSKLADGVQILVATPGRLIDLLYNSPLRLAEVRYFVLDEADEMLNQGFLSDIEFVFSCMVHEHHTMLFSATMPEEIKRLSKNYLTNAVTIELISEHKAPSSLIHQFQAVQPNHRFDKLVELIESEEPAQAIIFASSRTSCEKVYDHLKKKVSSVEQIHGGLDQNRRTSLFRRFKKLDIRFLVATDIASRGLDFSHATHIFNYDLPHGPEAYTHRTGRTARMGREGKAITFVTPKDMHKLKTILRANRIEPEWIGESVDLDKAGGKSDGKGRSGGRRGGGNRNGGQRGDRPRGGGQPSRESRSSTPRPEGAATEGQPQPQQGSEPSQDGAKRRRRRRKPKPKSND